MIISDQILTLGHSHHHGHHHSIVKCQSSMRNHQEGHNKRPEQLSPLSSCNCPRPKVVNNKSHYTPASTPQNIKRPITFSVRKNSRKGKGRLVFFEIYLHLYLSTYMISYIVRKHEENRRLFQLCWCQICVKTIRRPLFPFPYRDLTEID